MQFPLPRSLSPSKVASFRDCALAFRYANIDRLPRETSPAQLVGTIVHRSLELMFKEAVGNRTIEAAFAGLDVAITEAVADPENATMDLSPAVVAKMRSKALKLTSNYFDLEDPNTIDVVGTELTVEVMHGSLPLRGIIDRLDRDENGELVVTDYKTGRAPKADYAAPKMAGVHFYAMLCEEVMGRRPSRIQLLHLADPAVISVVPSDQSVRGLLQRTDAVWHAIERACVTGDFRPKKGPLCNWCDYQAICPAFGGEDPRVTKTRTGQLDLLAQGAQA